MFEIAFSTIWHVGVLAHVTMFHCPHHRVSYYFPHSFRTLAFYESVSAQSDSPPAWRLTFPVKGPYCWFLISLHPPLYKTMVSIASAEYIHSSEREADCLGLLASLLAIHWRPDVYANIISAVRESWWWLHCRLLNAQIIACVYSFSQGDRGVSTPPHLTFS